MNKESVEYLQNIVLKNMKIYVIGKCFFAKPSSTNYEEFIEKSDAYMRNACKRLGATHFAGSSADVDLFCAIKAKTFIQGRGFFLSLLWK